MWLYLVRNISCFIGFSDISWGLLTKYFSSALQASTLADDYAQASMYADSHLAEIGKKVHLLPAVSEGSIINVIVGS